MCHSSTSASVSNTSSTVLLAGATVAEASSSARRATVRNRSSVLQFLKYQYLILRLRAPIQVLATHGLYGRSQPTHLPLTREPASFDIFLLRWKALYMHI